MVSLEQGTVRMTPRLIQAAVLLFLAACGASPSASAGQSGGDLPFRVREVATFDGPWALAFLPGSGVPMTNAALVTEKPGKLWLVDVGNGHKQPVAGVPRVVVSSQGGLLDVVASPDFAGNQLVYLTYSEPSRNGGSGLALARAKLARGSGGWRLDGLSVIW